MENSAPTGRLSLASNSVLSADFVLLYGPNPGANATVSVQSGARAVVPVHLQFEANTASLVVDGGSVRADAGWYLRNPNTFAGSIALSDPAGGTAALTVGGHTDWRAGDLMPAFTGRITDASVGPNLRPAIGSLNGTADLTVTNTNFVTLDIGLGNQNGSYSGRLAVWADLTKFGTGTQTFSGGGEAVAFGVNGGTLVVDGGRWTLSLRGSYVPAAFATDGSALLDIRNGAVIDLPGGFVSASNTFSSAPAVVALSGAGTLVNAADLSIGANGTVGVAQGATLVAENQLNLLAATGRLVIDQGFVRTQLNSGSNGRITVSDAPQPAGTAAGALRTGLTLVAPVAQPGAFTNLTLNVPIADGPSGPGGVTFTGQRFVVTLTAAQTYSGATVADGTDATVRVPGGIASNDLVARQGGRVILQPDGQGRFDATGKTLRTDATGSFNYPAQLTGGTLLGPAHLASNTRFDGSTVGAGGVLTVPSNGIAGGSLVLAGGTLVNSGSTAAVLTVNSGGHVQGAGSFGAITLNAGGTFAPGDSPAKVNTGAVTLNAGARYEFEVANASGVAGTGFDQWFVTGGTTFAATAAAPFTVLLRSAGSGLGTGGLAANFDPTRAYRWAVLSTDTLAGFSGVTGAGLALDTAGWSNATAGGSFSLAWADNAGRSELNLSFAPVPEPGTWALMLGGAAALLAWRRRSGRALVS